MDDRGCRGRMARKHRPVLPAISILPSGSLATSFTKPIPQWDETGQRRRCCYVFNQRKKTTAIKTSTFGRMSILPFFFFFFVCASVCASETSEKQGHKKDREREQ